MRLVQHIEIAAYRRSRAWREALTQMLIDVGVLRPDGTPAVPVPSAAKRRGRRRAAAPPSRATLDPRQRAVRRRRKNLDARV